MLPMRWAHQSTAMIWLGGPFARSHFWFPKPVAPEVLVQAVIDVLCLLLTGYLTTRIYQASSQRQLLTPMVYPLLLVVCGVTYVMHTVRNFRFIYDLPSLLFFAGAMYLMYFRWHWIYFAILFVIATINRETALLLLSILRTSSELSYAVDQYFRPFGITPSQYNVLRILRGAGTDGLCRNEISERMVTATPDMSRLLDRMEKAGWVTRERAEDDRRQVSTYITKPGMGLLAKLETPTHDFVVRLFSVAAVSDLKTVLKVNDHIRTKLS
jgi:DNA-binding MarR family transcriptional regulator